MLLGNKCDIEAKRKVSKETGEKVRCRFWGLFCWGIECVTMRFFKALSQEGERGKRHFKQRGSGCLRKDRKCHVCFFFLFDAPVFTLDGKQEIIIPHVLAVCN